MTRRRTIERQRIADALVRLRAGAPSAWVSMRVSVRSLWPLLWPRRTIDERVRLEPLGPGSRPSPGEVVLVARRGGYEVARILKDEGSRILVEGANSSRWIPARNLRARVAVQHVVRETTDSVPESPEIVR